MSLRMCYYFLFSTLLKICRKPLHLLDQFSIFAARDNELNEQVASIRQKFTLLKHKFTVSERKNQFSNSSYKR